MRDLISLAHKLQIIRKLILGVFTGRVILIEDRQTSCKTFIGSKIRPERVNLLVCNLIQANNAV